MDNKVTSQLLVHLGLVIIQISSTSPCDDFLDLSHGISNGSEDDSSVQGLLTQLYN